MRVVARITILLTMLSVALTVAVNWADYMDSLSLLVHSIIA